jgi:hypothetical protein
MQAIAHSAKSAMRGSFWRFVCGSIAKPFATASSNTPRIRAFGFERRP